MKRDTGARSLRLLDDWRPRLWMSTWKLAREARTTETREGGPGEGDAETAELRVHREVWLDGRLPCTVMNATRKLTALTALLLFGFVARARDEKTWRLADAYRTHASHVTVVGSGTVTKLLRDDTQGARHQRFLLEVDGLSVLVAHNIDLARRVDPLRRGNTIEFRGEYIWNEKGGILHWTHHDPSGRHSPGWLKRNNVTFD